jgi:hypothetical protein
MTVLCSIYLVVLIYANLGEFSRDFKNPLADLIYYTSLLLFSVTPAAFLLFAWRKYFKQKGKR